MSNKLISIKGVSKLYRNHLVLDRLSFHIGKGEIFGIIGASGSGKTTLLKIIMGAVSPEEGDIILQFSELINSDEPIVCSVRKNPSNFRKVFGYASQDPSFYPELTVYENLSYFGSLYGLSSFAKKTNIKTLLSLMELTPHAKVLADNLSGGMQKRLDIACAMIHDPHILILDEPTADLDPVLRRQMWSLLNKINKHGTTILISSHFLEEIETICDRLAIIYDSGIAAIGTLAEIKRDFVKSEEIRIQTSPGAYSSWAPELAKRKSVSNISIETGQLVVRCNKSEIVLPFLLSLLSRKKETIVDLSVRKSSLNEVFEVLDRNEKSA